MATKRKTKAPNKIVTGLREALEHVTGVAAFTHAYCPNCREITPARLAANSKDSADLICARSDVLCAYVIATVFRKDEPAPKAEPV